MHVIDTAMIGKLGPSALAACGFSGTWIWTLLVPFAGIASGVQTFVARHDGAKQRNQCGGWVWQAFWMGAPAITLWSMLIALFLPQLFSLIGMSLWCPFIDQLGEVPHIAQRVTAAPG